MTDDPWCIVRVADVNGELPDNLDFDILVFQGVGRYMGTARAFLPLVFTHMQYWRRVVPKRRPGRLIDVASSPESF